LHAGAVTSIKGGHVRPFCLSIFIFAGCGTLALTNSHAAGLDKSQTRFVFTNAEGKVESAKIITAYSGKSTHPFAQIDPKLARAATIAEERAHAHSKLRCWHYVKQALLASGVVSSYPQTTLARQAGDELMRSYGFKRLAVRDPYQAPVGAVLVYGSGRAAGHVEIRTRSGFVSDFRTPTPSRRPLIGVYAKFSS
jgi:hypothetical protein